MSSDISLVFGGPASRRAVVVCFLLLNVAAAAGVGTVLALEVFTACEMSRFYTVAPSGRYSFCVHFVIHSFCFLSGLPIAPRHFKCHKYIFNGENYDGCQNY